LISRTSRAAAVKYRSVREPMERYALGTLGPLCAETALDGHPVARTGTAQSRSDEI
jgi:hypothetical protein